MHFTPTNSNNGGINKLEKDDNIILLSRSMFEGGLYLAYCVKYPEYAKRWRLFSYVLDIKRSLNEDPPEEVKNAIRKQKDEVDSLFLKTNNKGEKHYAYSWINKSIRTIARSTDSKFLKLYDEYYSPMSDYHHFGTRSFGIRYSCSESSISKIDNDEVNLEIVSALSMSLSSLFSTLIISKTILAPNNINIDSKIKAILIRFQKIEGMKTTEIKVATVTRK